VTQGESVSMALESITKASHLNVTKNVANAVGSQMAMQSSLFGRLGKARDRLNDDSQIADARKASAAKLLCTKTSSSTATLRNRH